MLEDALHSFHPHEYIRTHCPFLEPLRGSPRFESLVEEATRRSRTLANALGEHRST